MFCAIVRANLQGGRSVVKIFFNDPELPPGVLDVASPRDAENQIAKFLATRPPGAEASAMDLENRAVFWPKKGWVEVPANT